MDLTASLKDIEDALATGDLEASARCMMEVGRRKYKEENPIWPPYEAEHLKKCRQWMELHWGKEIKAETAASASLWIIKGLVYHRGK